MTRDMTKAQFNEAVSRHGFKPQGFMGYYQLPAPCDSARVSILNAGTRRRDQLAYLLSQFDREKKKRGITE